MLHMERALYPFALGNVYGMELHLCVLGEAFIAVMGIAAQNRASLFYTSANGGRIKKGSTILCSDSHHSYKGFAKDAEVEFHPINVSKGERVKGAFHVQHVNSCLLYTSD